MPIIMPHHQKCVPCKYFKSRVVQTQYFEKGKNLTKDHQWRALCIQEVKEIWSVCGSFLREFYCTLYCLVKHVKYAQKIFAKKFTLERRLFYLLILCSPGKRWEKQKRETLCHTSRVSFTLLLPCFLSNMTGHPSN